MRLFGVGQDVEHQHLVEARTIQAIVVHVALRKADVGEMNQTLARRGKYTLAAVEARIGSAALGQELRGHAIPRTYI